MLARILYHVQCVVTFLTYAGLGLMVLLGVLWWAVSDTGVHELLVTHNIFLNAFYPLAFVLSAAVLGLFGALAGGLELPLEPSRKEN